MLNRIDHVGILVDNIEEAKALLSSLGLAKTQDSETPLWGRIWAYFHCGNAEIELIQDLDPAIRRRVLGTDKARVEHIAFEVGALNQALISLGVLGIRPDEHGIVRGTMNGRARDAVWSKPDVFAGLVCQFVSYPTEAQEPAT